jgi:putative transposase
LLKQLTWMPIERAWEAEMSSRLGHGKSGEVTNDTANTRNGRSAKTLKPGNGD